MGLPIDSCQTISTRANKLPTPAIFACARCDMQALQARELRLPCPLLPGRALKSSQGRNTRHLCPRAAPASIGQNTLSKDSYISM